MFAFIVTAACSYLLGSIPFGYILVRIFCGQDVRNSGSGNIGATNVSRTSPALGALTLLLDALKGLAAVFLAHTLFPGHNSLPGAAALFAIAGHTFPIWLGFRGGKGVATGLGSFLVLAPKTVLVMVGIFALVFLLFRYVSLSSIIAVALLPLLAWIVEPSRNTPQTLAFMAAASLLIIVRHHENIRRLLTGTEPQFQWRRR